MGMLLLLLPFLHPFHSASFHIKHMAEVLGSAEGVEKVWGRRGGRDAVNIEEVNQEEQKEEQKEGFGWLLENGLMKDYKNLKLYELQEEPDLELMQEPEDNPEHSQEVYTEDEEEDEWRPMSPEDRRHVSLTTFQSLAGDTLAKLPLRDSGGLLLLRGILRRGYNDDLSPKVFQEAGGAPRPWLLAPLAQHQASTVCTMLGSSLLDPVGEEGEAELARLGPLLASRSYWTGLRLASQSCGMLVQGAGSGAGPGAGAEPGDWEVRLRDCGLAALPLCRGVV